MCLLSENELNETEFDGLLKFLQAKRKQNPLEFSITMEILKEYDERIATKLNDSLVLSKQLSGILTQGLNGNPRQCKRFLNTLDMRQKMANYKNVTLKSNVLAKIMEVEYFQTSLFRKMVNLLGDNMLKTELEGFETDQEDKINALDPWKNELWVKKWMKAKPMLSEEKLENYFYFMRAFSKDNIFTSVEKMSEEAKKIFEGISKHSDLAFNQAKMAVDKISVFDQHQILDGLYQDVISDDIARLVIAPRPPVTAISIPNFIPPFITLNLSILSYKAFNVIFAAPDNSRHSFIPSKIDAKIAVLASS